MPPRTSGRIRQRLAKKQRELFAAQLANAANDVLSNGIVEHEHDDEVPQKPQTKSALDRMTSAEPGSKAQVRNIPVTKARDSEANMRMNRVGHPHHVSLQSPREPAELRHARCSQPSRLEAPGSRAKRSPSPTAMAGQIILTPQEISMLVKQEVQRALRKIGASEETIRKAVDDDWAFAEDETQQTRQTSVGSTGSSASEKPAAQEKTSKGTQCTTSTQGKAEDPRVQKFQVKLAELRKMLDEKKTEEFKPKFQEASGEIEIQLPPNVENLDHWGTAVAQHGKYQGKSYKTAFDDKNYRKWLVEHFHTLTTAPMRDLATYVICQTKAEMAKADA